MLSADDTPTPLSPAAESDQHKLLRGATSSTTTTPFKAPPQFRRADSSILAQRKREQLAAQPVGVAFAPSSWISSLSILRETIVDRVLYRPWLVLTLATAIFCGISTAAGGGVSLGPDVPMGVGVTMSLLLGFRLNVSYQRWWEGRLLWGDVTVSTRSLMTLLLSSAPPRAATPPPGFDPSAPTAAQQAAGWLLAFTTCLKRRLRDQPSELDSESPAARLLGAAAAARLLRSAHPPLHALCALRAALAAAGAALRPHELTSFELTALQYTHRLHVAMTGCERISRTPCPPGYVAVLRLVILVFLFLLPPVLLDELGLWTVVVVSATAFILFAAEQVAVQIEMPFGHDSNDLPLDSLCVALEADVLTLLDEFEAAADD